MKKKMLRRHMSTPVGALARRIGIVDQAVATAKAWGSTGLYDELRHGARRGAPNAKKWADRDSPVDVPLALSHEVIGPLSAASALGTRCER